MRTALMRVTEQQKDAINTLLELTQISHNEHELNDIKTVKKFLDDWTLITNTTRGKQKK